MTDEDLKQIDALLGRHLGVMTEVIQQKFDLVMAGQQALSAKLDRMGARWRVRQPQQV